jgi:curved DNA-binding protein CbpA
LAADPYQTLGVTRDVSQEEIQKAYRRLAKKLHPDLNPGNKKAEEEFKNVSVAYDLLGNPDKRARFDRGEIDASGAERPQHRYYRDFAEAGASHPTRPTRASRTLPARTMFCRKSSGAAGAPTCACEGRMCIIASNSTSLMQSMAQSGSSRFPTNRRSTSPFRPARATARFSVFAAKDGRVSEASRLAMH